MDLGEDYKNHGLGWMNFKPQWLIGPTNQNVVGTVNQNGMFYTPKLKKRLINTLELISKNPYTQPLCWQHFIGILLTWKEL
jgi:hypothetical protein